jgi:hypothetical protein
MRSAWVIGRSGRIISVREDTYLSRLEGTRGSEDIYLLSSHEEEVHSFVLTGELVCSLVMRRVFIYATKLVLQTRC